MTKNFGGITAVLNLDISIQEGETVGLIGPNGAGKTTVLNLITGLLKPSEGKIFFQGKEISYKKPHVIAKLGIGRTFQLAYFFPDFTVFENIVASFHLHPKSRFWEALFNTASYRKKEKYIKEQATEILHLVGLASVKDILAKNLPHGYQKLLTMARALATKPNLLLLDEPIAGMSFKEINFAINVIGKIKSSGVTLLLVEHNMRLMTLCNRIIVINFGSKVAEGSMKEIRENQKVVEAYFGREDAT